MILDQISGSFELAEQIGQIFFYYVFGYLPEFKYSSFYCLLMVFITSTVVRNYNSLILPRPHSTYSIFEFILIIDKSKFKPLSQQTPKLNRL